MEILDSGFVAVKVRSTDGTVVEQEVDLFQLWVELREVINSPAAQESDRAAYEGFVDVIAKHGFPRLSWGAADAFAAKIFAAVKEFKKKDGGSSTPGSPGSTASTPGN